MVAATQTTVPAALDLYPEVSYTDAKGKSQTERANKYFVMFGYEGEGIGTTIAQRRLAEFNVSLLFHLDTHLDGLVKV